MSERFFPDGMPPPMADTITLPFWQAAAEHRLVVQRCTDCAATRHPPSPVCPACRPDGSDWQEVSGWHADVLAKGGIVALTEEVERALKAEFEAVAEAAPKLRDYLAHHRPFYEQARALAIGADGGVT